MSLPAKKPSSHYSILGLKIGKDKLTAAISDGRSISVPLAWFPRLVNAQKQDLNSFVISPGGYGIHWPALDEDISIKAFLE